MLSLLMCVLVSVWQPQACVFVQMFVVLSIVSFFLLVLLSGWLLVVAVCPVSSAQVCVRLTQDWVAAFLQAGHSHRLLQRSPVWTSSTLVLINLNEGKPAIRSWYSAQCRALMGQGRCWWMNCRVTKGPCFIQPSPKSSRR